MRVIAAVESREQSERIRLGRKKIISELYRRCVEFFYRKFTKSRNQSHWWLESPPRVPPAAARGKEKNGNRLSPSEL